MSRLRLKLDSLLAFHNSEVFSLSATSKLIKHQLWLIIQNKNIMQDCILRVNSFGLNSIFHLMQSHIEIELEMFRVRVLIYHSVGHVRVERRHIN